MIVQSLNGQAFAERNVAHKRVVKDFVGGFEWWRGQGVDEAEGEEGGEDEAEGVGHGRELEIRDWRLEIGRLAWAKGE